MRRIVSISKAGQVVHPWHAILKYSQVTDVHSTQHLLQLLQQCRIFRKTFIVSSCGVHSLIAAWRDDRERQQRQDVCLSEIDKPDGGCLELRRIHWNVKESRKTGLHSPVLRSVKVHAALHA